MFFWSLLIPALIGIAIAALLWKRHWGFTLISLLLLVAISFGGAAAIEQLSPESFARLPVSGGTLGRIGAWCMAAAIGIMIALGVRGGMALKPRAAQARPTE